MLNNNYVRIALFIVLVVVLYWLVITLARNEAGADDMPMISGVSGHLEDAAAIRESAPIPE